MLFVVLALLAAAAIFAVLWPLSRPPRATPSSLAIYRDQLEEIARDRASGTLALEEAEAARVEISRRLLAAADVEPKAPPTGSLVDVRPRRVVAVIALAVIPVGAFALYLALGSPALPGQPLAAREQASNPNPTVAELVARVEASLAKNPDDGRGWEVIAPVYMQLGRFDQAVSARQSALRLLGETSERQADLGEALMAAANGIVTDDAKSAFERATALDPQSIPGRFYLGLAAAQDGHPADAARGWRELIAGAAKDAAWLPSVRQALAQLGGVAPGPSKDDVAAAETMSPDDRVRMIRGMVEGLANRLKQDGSDVDGWLRLVRAYRVLGETDKAGTAIDDARRALASENDKLRRFDDGMNLKQSGG